MTWRGFFSGSPVNPHQFPRTVPEFIEWLDQVYPHRCPNPQDSEREIWMKAGERRLVDSLKFQYQRHLDEMQLTQELEGSTFVTLAP
jgi:hypothetical protein